VRAGRNACTVSRSGTLPLGLLFAGILLIVPVASAAPASSSIGTLFIIVEDAGSRRIAGASITVSSTPIGPRFSAVTGANGTWGFDIPAGEYDVLITKTGFRDYTVHKRVEDKLNVTVPAQMAADPGGPVGSGFYVFAGVLAAVVAIGVVGTLLKRRRRARVHRAETEAPDEESGPKQERGTEAKKARGKTPEATPVATRTIDVVSEAHEK